jgi:hypothetical protein
LASRPGQILASAEGFPHPPLNRLYLPRDTDMQRIEKTPERALRRQLGDF